MTEKLSKIPNWVYQLVVNIIMLAFFAGGAYETFAPKGWVMEKIADHTKVTEEARKEDAKEIKEALKRIEERQYEQAKKH